MRCGRTVVLAAALLLAWPGPGHAFPGSARWGYGNCVACHYNPAGGGLVNAYGRQMSRELLSAGGSERAALFAFGKVTPPRWLSVGGDFSFLQTSAASSRRLRTLQADLEAVGVRGPLLFQGTIGLAPEVRGRRTWSNAFISRRHYLQYQITPTLSARAGRFLPNFGIWNGDLRVATKSGGAWQETYNVEANWIRERGNLGVTVIGGGGEAADVESEHGLAATTALVVGDKGRAGVSYAHKQSRARSRDVFATYGVFGYGRHGYLLEEIDLQRLETRPPGEGDPPWMAYSNWCLAYEMTKGLYVLAIEEWSRPRLGGRARFVNSYGAALRWFPRSHVEMQLRWRKQDPEALSPDYLDGLSAFFHFYP